MDRTMKMIAGVGLGAGLMYFLDPTRGRARRARLQGQLTRLTHEACHAADVVSRDATNRAQGLWAEARSAVSGTTPDDRTLAERVRAHLGRCVSHPRAIAVTAHEGTVTLSGPVLAREVNGVVGAIGNVPGVRRVESRLEIHRDADIPALQGGVSRTGARAELAQKNWSPTTRTLAGAVGVGLMGNCLVQRDLTACVLGTIGFGLFLRATTNAPIGDAVRQAATLAPEAPRPPRAAVGSPA
jgi:hypothetical protein